MKNKLIIAVTGASGSIYAERLLKLCLLNAATNSEITLILSNTAKDVWKYEIGNTSYTNFGLKVFENNDLFAPMASGSAMYNSMIICPCSMGTLGRIAGGITDTLITRAADVMIKERRKLILVPRETPLNLIHLRNMETVTLAGGIICPAMPSFYSKPITLEQAIDTVCQKVLSLAGYTISQFEWGKDNY